MSQNHINDNINSFNTVNNVWNNNCSEPDEKSEILAWISPLEPQIRHHDIRTCRVDKVGDWLLRTEEYRSWFEGINRGKSDGSALFCYGGPGVGKTYISSLVIDTLCKQAVGGNTAVACFYFDFAAQEEQSPTAMLASVLKQVVGGLDEIPERMVKAFRDRGKVIGGQRLALPEIVEFLQDISSTRTTFICIDALDECQAGHRVKLLDSLNKILQKPTGARIFLTGRPHVGGEVEKHLAGRAATRSITPTKSDIIIFLRAKLREDTVLDAMDESLEQEIIQNIPETVSEIFLLVFLSVEAILEETTIYRRRQKLSAMKNGLDLGDAYKATLGRIKAQGGEKARLGIAALMWISHSRRPLQVDEICQAISIRIGSNGLNSGDIPTIPALLSYCQGLVSMDKGASAVRLVHFTLQEYLYKHPDIFDRAHSTMAETCLTYLNFQQIKDLSVGPSPHPGDAPFLEYSSLHWGTHMRIEISDRAKASALELLSQFDSHICAKSLWKSINEELLFYRDIGDEPFSALHCISYFGIAEVANALVEMNRWDVNERDGAGMTPLIWAARHGHEEVVKLLLRKKDIQPNRKDTEDGRTALSWAAENGHEGVVKLFLRPRFVDPGSIGGRLGRTARAASVLFGRRYVSPDTPDTCYKRTPLFWAAGNGHEGIVKLLLDRKDVNPDSSDKFGLTPLSWTAEKGHEGVVKLLLECKGVNPDISGGSGQTLLSWAAEKGHEGIVKLLLDRKDVNPDSSNEFGQTPLSRAAENGHERIVRLLLERKDINPNSSCKSGRTSLSRAAENGHSGIVRLLLGRGDINPNSSDKYGQTPISWAAEKGREGVVKLLLERKDITPDILDKFGQTPLSLAARNGHERIVKLLLERKDVNPNTADPVSSGTPLSWAARNGHEGVVKLLLKREDVNPNSLNKFGQTPLTLAAENGHDRVVELLQARNSRPIR